MASTSRRVAPRLSESITRRLSLGPTSCLNGLWLSLMVVLLGVKVKGIAGCQKEKKAIEKSS
jgi:hypothetical protein